MIRRDDLRFGLSILHTENTSTGWLSSVKIFNRNKDVLHFLF